MVSGAQSLGPGGTVEPQVSCADAAASWRKQKLRVPKCFVCKNPKLHPDDTCRFKGRRIVTGEDATNWSFHAPEDTPMEEPAYRRIYSMKQDVSIIDTKMALCAVHLLPWLQSAQKHQELPGTIKMPLELGLNTTCDMCETSLFVCTWLCICCGREFCNECMAICQYVTCTNDLQRHDIRPITRFDSDELARMVEEMTSMPIAPQQASCVDVPHPPDQRGSTPLYQSGSLHVTDFHRYLRAGIPIIISGLHHVFQERWDPSYFKDLFGNEPHDAVDCESEDFAKVEIPLDEFFGAFEKQPHEHTKVLKIKDWPSTKTLAEKCKTHVDDWNGFVPFPHHTRYDGIFNAMSHFPRNALPPDIGPKMYLGLANGANSSFGTTRAHTDFADAVNVLNFASHGPDGSPGSAHWVIIPNSSMETLSTYIREKKNVPHGAHNPIHPQTVFLTPADVEELREIYGVPVHSFDQYPGDAVFIPAGCPHQVSNNTNCIKTACDFVSFEGLTRTLRIADDFRTYRLSKNTLTDILKIKQVLYYTWKSLRNLRDELHAAPSVGAIDLTQLLIAKFPTATGRRDQRHQAVQTDEYVEKQIVQANKRTAAELEGNALDAQTVSDSEDGERPRKRPKQLPKPNLPGHDYHCIFTNCGTCRWFSRGGFFDHTIHKHIGEIPPDERESLEKIDSAEGLMKEVERRYASNP